MRDGQASRVKLVAYSDATSFGGAEQALANLLECLDDAFEVSVLAVAEKVGEAVRAARPGAALHLVESPRNKWDAGPILRHVLAIRSLRPDIFHANLWTSVRGQYGVFAALLAPGVRTVVVEHAPLPTRSGLQRLLKRSVSRRVAEHVAVGEQSARAVEEAVGLPPHSVRTIYNGVPDVEIEPFPRRADGPVIGSLGRLEQEKGYDVALRAVRALPGATLVLVGDGSERARLEALARELGVAERVEFAGWSDEARRYLPGFDVFVLPTRSDAFPLAIVEAMLAGVPVVASDVGSISEALLDGETGFLVPPQDEEALAERIGRLLSSCELGRELGLRGRARARSHFTAEAMARSFESLYREMLA